MNEELDRVAGEVWRDIKHEWEQKNGKLPDGWTGIGGAYGSYSRLIEALESYANSRIQEFVREVEGMKQKHWVFECNGPRPNKTTKFEDFCDDKECRSDDNKRVNTHNQVIDTILALAQKYISKEDKK